MNYADSNIFDIFAKNTKFRIISKTNDPNNGKII